MLGIKMELAVGKGQCDCCGDDDVWLFRRDGNFLCRFCVEDWDREKGKEVGGNPEKE